MQALSHFSVTNPVMTCLFTHVGMEQQLTTSGKTQGTLGQITEFVAGTHHNSTSAQSPAGTILTGRIGSIQSQKVLKREKIMDSLCYLISNPMTTGTTMKAVRD